jgi:hypothetical protein
MYSCLLTVTGLSIYRLNTVSTKRKLCAQISCFETAAPLSAPKERKPSSEIQKAKEQHLGIQAL